MKQYLLALALVMSIGATNLAWASSAPKHRYHATSTEQVDQKEKASPENDKQKAVKEDAASDDNNGDALEAYSDTTSTDAADTEDRSYDEDNDNGRSYHSQYSLGNYDDPFDFLGSVFGKGTLIFFIVLFSILGLLFVFAPLIIIFLIVRYLMRRHNDRIKLAEMAMEKGINVPESDRPIDKQSNEYLVKRGLRNAFLGAGLFFMFTIWDAEFLAGLGALVFFYGIGQVVIGSLPVIKQWWNNRQGNGNGPGFTGTAI